MDINKLIHSLYEKAKMTQNCQLNIEKEKQSHSTDIILLQDLLQSHSNQDKSVLVK